MPKKFVDFGFGMLYSCLEVIEWVNYEEEAAAGDESTVDMPLANESI